MFLTGVVESGKTCAALCLLDAFGGSYSTEPTFCEMLILAQNRELELVGQGGATKVLPCDVWRTVRDDNLFVLDELGMRELSPHRYDCVKRALDARHGKPAIFISNLPLKELGKLGYDERIRCRLERGTEVTLKDKWRGKKQEVTNGNGN